MKQQELIDFVNGSYFISLKECKEKIKLNPVYENCTNIPQILISVVSLYK